MVQSTPHAWAPCDLGFPLLITGVLFGTHLSWSNSAVWITDARCHIGLTLLSKTRRDILVINVWPLISILAHAAYETCSHAVCGTQLTWPTITSGQLCMRNGWYTSPLVSSCNLFSEETKSLPLATYVALGERTWTVYRSDVSPYFVLICAHVAGSTTRAYCFLCSLVYVKPFQNLALHQCSITSLTLSSIIRFSRALFLLLHHSRLSIFNSLKVWFLLHDLPSFHDSVAHNMR